MWSRRRGRCAGWSCALPELHPQAVALVGPTASGKSAVAIEAALRDGDVEIVSIDSMAVYRRMDIGTATPTVAERSGVPHHLLDVLEPWDDCTMSLFQDLALAAVDDIELRGRIPLLVGGTGLYHRAVIDRLDIPGQYPSVRMALEAEAALPGGPSALHARLVGLDPVAAGRIEPGNVRRIVRALEVCEGAGVPFSSFGPGLEEYPPASIAQVGLLPDLEAVLDAVERRIRGWVDAGLLDEVAALVDDRRGLSRTAAQAIGYREIIDHLSGAITLDEAIAETIRRTRVLVRRQISWFRRDPRIRWATTREGAATALGEALAEARRPTQVRD